MGPIRGAQGAVVEDCGSRSETTLSAAAQNALGQGSAVHFSAMLFSVVQCSAVQFNKV